jgi:hypothetical protein
MGVCSCVSRWALDLGIVTAANSGRLQMFSHSPFLCWEGGMGERENVEEVLRDVVTPARPSSPALRVSRT